MSFQNQRLMTIYSMFSSGQNPFYITDRTRRKAIKDGLSRLTGIEDIEQSEIDLLMAMPWCDVQDTFDKATAALDDSDCEYFELHAQNIAYVEKNTKGIYQQTKPPEISELLLRGKRKGQEGYVSPFFKNADGKQPILEFINDEINGTFAVVIACIHARKMLRLIGERVKVLRSKGLHFSADLMQKYQVSINMTAFDLVNMAHNYPSEFNEFLRSNKEFTNLTIEITELDLFNKKGNVKDILENKTRLLKAILDFKEILEKNGTTIAVDDFVSNNIVHMLLLSKSCGVGEVKICVSDLAKRLDSLSPNEIRAELTKMIRQVNSQGSRTKVVIEQVPVGELERDGDNKRAAIAAVVINHFTQAVTQSFGVHKPSPIEEAINSIEIDCLTTELALMGFPLGDAANDPDFPTNFHNKPLMDQNNLYKELAA